jgi:hypothetical protein
VDNKLKGDKKVPLKYQGKSVTNLSIGDGCKKERSRKLWRIFRR